MTECESCGARASRKAKIEGVIMDVCEKCVELGKEIVRPNIPTRRPVSRMLEGMNVVVKANLKHIVKKEREKRGLTQEQLAKKLMLRASVITRIESGWEPSLPIVEKLERFFGIELKEEAEASSVTRNVQNKELTLGDIVEIKKK